MTAKSTWRIRIAERGWGFHHEEEWRAVKRWRRGKSWIYSARGLCNAPGAEGTLSISDAFQHDSKQLHWDVLILEHVTLQKKKIIKDPKKYKEEKKKERQGFVNKLHWALGSLLLLAAGDRTLGLTQSGSSCVCRLEHVMLKSHPSVCSINDYYYYFYFQLPVSMFSTDTVKPEKIQSLLLSRPQHTELAWKPWDP